MPRVEYREVRCKSALNRVRGMPFRWSLNPYTGCVHRCHYCYARAYYARAEHGNADEDFETRILVKVNFAEVLARELGRPSWKGEQVALGTATDPYQPAEGRYRLTRACIEAFGEAASPFSIITRGPMIVRDLDVLVEAARKADVAVTFSIPTLDEDVWRKTEPSTAHPRQRLRAVKELVDAGIKVGVGMAPILPGISDKPEQLREVVSAAREAGATGVWTNVLFLRPGTREHFLEHLAEDWPELLEHYLELYEGRAYLPSAEAKPLRQQVAALAKEHGIKDRRENPLDGTQHDEQLALAV